MDLGEESSVKLERLVQEDTTVRLGEAAGMGKQLGNVGISPSLSSLCLS